MIEYYWSLIFLITLLLFVSGVDHILLISLKIKKCRTERAINLIKFFETNHNKKLNFYESPLLNESFALDVKSNNEVSIIISRGLMDILSEEDIKEVVENAISIFKEKKSTLRLFSILWLTFFTAPYALINLPTLFHSKRVLIFEKFFSLPIFYFSQMLIKKVNFVLNPTKSTNYKINKNSMITKINEEILGPHLLFFINSYNYKLLRESKLAEN